MGIPHGFDLEFVFGLTLLNPESTPENLVKLELSKLFMKYWTDFAKYGKLTNDWLEMLSQKASFVKNSIPDQSLELR